MSRVLTFVVTPLILFLASCQAPNGDWIAELRTNADVEAQISRLRDTKPAEPFKALGAMCEIVRNSPLLTAAERKEAKNLATTKLRGISTKVMFDLIADGTGRIESAIPYTADWIYISLLTELGDYSEPLAEVEELLDSADLRARLAALDLIALSGVASPSARSKIEILATNDVQSLRSKALSASIGLGFEPKVLSPLLYSALKAGGRAAQVATEHLRVNGDEKSRERIREICWSTSCDYSLLELHFEMCKRDAQCMANLRSDRLAPVGTRMLLLCHEALQRSAGPTATADYIELRYGAPESELGLGCAGKLGAFSPANVLRLFELSEKYPGRYWATDDISELTDRDSPEVLDAIVLKLRRMLETNTREDLHWLSFFRKDLGRYLFEKAIARGNIDQSTLTQMPQFELMQTLYLSDQQKIFEMPWSTRLGLAVRPYVTPIGLWLGVRNWPEYDEFRPFGGCTERDTPLWRVVNFRLAADPGMTDRLIASPFDGLRPWIFQYSMVGENLSVEQYRLGAQDPDPRVRIAVAHSMRSAEIAQADAKEILRLLSEDRTPSVKWAARSAEYYLSDDLNLDEEDGL